MLPVLYVPPVTPPSPEDRPPRQRRAPRLALVATLLIGTPLLAWATLGLGFAAPERLALAATPIETAEPAATGTVRLAEAPTGPAAGPATSGGSQPYLVGGAPHPKAEPKPEPESAASEPVPATEGAGVRVIDMNRKGGAEPLAPAKAAPSAPTDAPTGPATAEAPAKPVDVAAPTPAPVTPAPAAPAPAARVEPPAVTAPAMTPSELRPSVEPSAATAKAEPPAAVPAVAPPPPQTMPAPTAPASTPKAAAKPAVKPAATSSVVVAEPPTGSPHAQKPAETRPAERRPGGLAPLAAPSTPPGLQPVAPPRPASSTSGRDDFADRLATVRRDESRRLQAPPPASWDDEEEVVVAPRRRGWSVLPPFLGGDEPPPRAVLRPFEAPPRLAERPTGHSNCHYHAWPSEEMEFHRAVECHWHRNARDPSLRYLR